MKISSASGINLYKPKIHSLGAIHILRNTVRGGRGSLSLLRFVTWGRGGLNLCYVTKKKQGLKQANTSMSIPPLASYAWAIKQKRNRKTTEKNRA